MRARLQLRRRRRRVAVEESPNEKLGAIATAQPPLTRRVPVERGPVDGAGVYEVLMQDLRMRKRAGRDMDIVSTRRAAGAPTAAHLPHILR